PILYLFFNAQLVGKAVNKTKGALRFVNNYTRWTVGDSVEENMDVLQHAVVPSAL
ncbi:hypothetical protein K505DRAFT_257199, partial [Melanomma pulvis-pyrius CBS 109.77]